MKEEKGQELQTRPFHEVVMEDIGKATTIRELWPISFQLKRITIPAGEVDKIFAGWSKRCIELGTSDLHFGVGSVLLQQKEAAQEKAARGFQQGVELHELQAAMEAFLALSHNHHLSGSLVSWHHRLRVQLQNLHKLLSRALGK